MGSIYTPYDYGEAILVKGIPYIRIGTQAAASTYTLNSETDFQDIADNDPGGNFTNDGVTFTYDNTSPLSASWTLEQCSIACGVEAFTSIDWSADTETVDHTAESGMVSFFTAPSDGELRVWAPSGGIWFVGINGLIIFDEVNGNDYGTLGRSRGMRVSQGIAVQAAGDDVNDDHATLADTPPLNPFAWAFLPDEY